MKSAHTLANNTHIFKFAVKSTKPLTLTIPLFSSFKLQHMYGSSHAHFLLLVLIISELMSVLSC